MNKAIHWIEAGAGPTGVLMLHGVGGSAAVWPAQMQALPAAGYRALAWDTPGYGESPTVAPYTIARLAEALEAFLARLDVPQLVLVGHSMGGMIAQELMVRAPGRVQGLVLYATSPAFGRPEGDWQRQFLAARLGPLDAGRTMAELAGALVGSMAGDAADDAGLACAREAMARVDPATYRASMQALVGFDRRAALGAIDVPTLLVAGEKDPNAPPQVMRRMAGSMPRAEYQELPGAGHLAHLEQPAAFNAVLLDFLRRYFPAAAPSRPAA
jgi:3-oxoadipate enol-lactonase